MTGRVQCLAVLLLTLATSGCVSLPVVGPPLLLARADRQAGEGAWEAAVASYDEFLARFPQDPAAPRALRSRDTLVATLEAQQELARRREEVGRLRSELARLQQEEARLRQEKAQLRQEEAQLREDRRRLRVETSEMRNEVTRLRGEGSELREELTRRQRDLARTRQELGARQAEAERLRSDLERLKEIDLQPERKR